MTTNPADLANIDQLFAAASNEAVNHAKRIAAALDRGTDPAQMAGMLIQYHCGQDHDRDGVISMFCVAIVTLAKHYQQTRLAE